MRFYGTPYQDTLDLPLRTFWMMSNNVSRLSAEEDIRRLAISAGSASEKGFKSTQEALQREMGDVFIKPQNIEAREGINTLKEIASKQVAQR
jgi:hypothetical protein